MSTLTESVKNHKWVVIILIVGIAGMIAFWIHYVTTLESMCNQLYSAAQDYEQTYGKPLSYYAKSCNGPHANPFGVFIWVR